MLHLDLPTQAQIERLADTRSEASISIYIAANPLTQESDLARISLKNLGREAITQLEEAGVEKRTIWPIEEFLTDLDEDEDFWKTQANSLAVFITPTRLKTFRLANHLADQVHVSDRFSLAPLLRATSFANNAWILALAEGGVRLIDVPAEGAATEVRVPDLPKDAYDALGRTTLNDRGANRRIVGDEGKNVRLRQYVRIVDDAVMKVLANSHRPLIIAAADPLGELYAQHTDYRALADTRIMGNPEKKTDAELAAEARPVLDGLQKDKIGGLHALFSERASADRASTDLAHVAIAATMGAVDTLLVDIDATEVGSMDDTTGALSLDPEDDATNYTIADETALRVMRHGGRVMAVRRDDLPDANSPVAAILRYAI